MSETLQQPENDGIIVVNSAEKATREVKTNLTKLKEEYPSVISFTDKQGAVYFFEDLSCLRAWLTDKINEQIQGATTEIREQSDLPEQRNFLPGINFNATNGLRDDISALFRRYDERWEDQTEKLTPEELSVFTSRLCTNIQNLHDAIQNMDDTNRKMQYLTYLKTVIDALPYEKFPDEELPRELRELKEVSKNITPIHIQPQNWDVNDWVQNTPQRLIGDLLEVPDDILIHIPKPQQYKIHTRVITRQDLEKQIGKQD